MASGDSKQLEQALRALTSELKKATKGGSSDPTGTGSGGTDFDAQADSADDILKKYKEMEELQKDRKKAIESYNKKLRESTDLSKEKILVLKKEKKIQEDLLEAQEEKLKGLKKELSVLGKMGEAYQKFKGGAAKAKAALGTLNSAIDGASNSASTLAEKFGGLERGLLTFDTAKAQSLKVDQLSVSLQRSSGLTGDFTNNLIDTQRELQSFGITSEATAGAIQSLGAGMSNFTRMDKFSREELTKTVLKFTTLGVSVEDTTKLLETGTKTLGMSNEQALTLQANLVKTAKGIGIAPAQMVQGFASAAPRLAAHGNAMEKVFKGLALQSKNTGASIDELLGAAAGFDTFESAAQKTSQLNAMFGTQLNSVEMLNASEEERIQIMKASLAASGKSIDTMGRFEIKSLAQILGMDDGGVRRMFGGAEEGLEDLEKKASASQSDMNLEKEMMKTVTAQERFVAGNEAFKNTSVKYVLPELRNQALALTTNKDLMNDFVKAGEFAGKTYGKLIKGATKLQGTFAGIAAAEGAIDLKNTLLSPLNSALLLASSLMNVLGGIPKLFKGMQWLAKAPGKLMGKVGGFFKDSGNFIAKGARTAGKKFADSRVGQFASKTAGKISGAFSGKIGGFFKAAGKGLSKFAGPIVTGLMAGGDAYRIWNDDKLSKNDKAKELLKVGGGAIGSLVLGAAGAAGGPITAIMGAMAGDWVGRQLAGSDMVQDLLAPQIAKLLPDSIDGGGATASTDQFNSTAIAVNSPPPSRPALVPPRVTPTATATNAQTANLTSTIGQMAGNTSEKFQPIINLTAYLGGKHIASRLVVDGLNQANTLSGVATSNV